MTRHSVLAGLIVVFALALPGSTSAQTPPPATDVVATAVAKAKAENKAVLIEFGASWCTWCRNFEAFVKSPDAGPILAEHFVIVNLTVRERDDKKVLEHPGGDSSEIRALGLGSFVLAFATAYAAPSAARAALRLNHRLSLRREATGLAQCGHIAHNRGTNGCDRGGTNAHGIVKLTANEDVQAFQENTSNQVDTAVDLVGVETATDFLTKLQAIKLRDLGQRPHPAVLHAAAPT